MKFNPSDLDIILNSYSLRDEYPTFEDEDFSPDDTINTDLIDEFPNIDKHLFKNKSDIFIYELYEKIFKNIVIPENVKIWNLNEKSIKLILKNENNKNRINQGKNIVDLTEIFDNSDNITNYLINVLLELYSKGKENINELTGFLLRALQAYPSLNREKEFISDLYKIISEKFEILVNRNEDKIFKTDINISYNGKNFYIWLFDNTYFSLQNVLQKMCGLHGGIIRKGFHILVPFNKYSLNNKVKENWFFYNEDVVFELTKIIEEICRTDYSYECYSNFATNNNNVIINYKNKFKTYKNFYLNNKFIFPITSNYDNIYKIASELFELKNIFIVYNDDDISLEKKYLTITDNNVYKNNYKDMYFYDLQNNITDNIIKKHNKNCKIEDYKYIKEMKIKVILFDIRNNNIVNQFINFVQRNIFRSDTLYIFFTLRNNKYNYEYKHSNYDYNKIDRDDYITILKNYFSLGNNMNYLYKTLSYSNYYKFDRQRNLQHFEGLHNVYYKRYIDELINKNKIDLKFLRDNPIFCIYNNNFFNKKAEEYDNTHKKEKEERLKLLNEMYEDKLLHYDSEYGDDRSHIQNRELGFPD